MNCGYIAVYFSKLPNVFVEIFKWFCQIIEAICSDFQMYLLSF